METASFYPRPIALRLVKTFVLINCDGQSHAAGAMCRTEHHNRSTIEKYGPLECFVGTIVSNEKCQTGGEF